MMIKKQLPHLASDPGAPRRGAVPAPVTWRGIFILSLLLLGELPISVSAVTVSGSLNRNALEIGDTLTVHVVGKRVTGEAEFLGATVGIPPDWRRGGQSILSPRVIADTTIKEWTFQFIPTTPGSTQVTPVVIVGQEVAINAAVDSIRGIPLLVAVSPVSVPPVWPWFLAGAVLFVGTLSVVVRILRRRREHSFERTDEPPLAEALKMLESMRTNRREDRGRQYLVDVERVIHGYLGRRLGIRLTGMTATEIGAAVTPHCEDAEGVEALTTLLKRCGEAKFGGVHINYDTLTGIEGQAQSVLERLDAKWV